MTRKILALWGTGRGRGPLGCYLGATLGHFGGTLGALGALGVGGLGLSRNARGFLARTLRSGFPFLRALHVIAAAWIACVFLCSGGLVRLPLRGAGPEVGKGRFQSFVGS